MHWAWEVKTLDPMSCSAGTKLDGWLILGAAVQDSTDPQLRGLLCRDLHRDDRPLHKCALPLDRVKGEPSDM